MNSPTLDYSLGVVPQVFSDHMEIMAMDDYLWSFAIAGIAISLLNSSSMIPFLTTGRLLLVFAEPPRLLATAYGEHSKCRRPGGCGGLAQDFGTGHAGNIGPAVGIMTRF